MAGRHTSWSIITITAIIAARPHTSAGVSPALAAACRYEPSPGSRKSRLPSTNISHAIRKNHPPATDTIEFQIRPIVPYGSSSCRKRCTAPKR